MRRGVGKHLVDQPARLLAAYPVVLQKTAADQPAHGMSHQVDPEVGGLHLAAAAHLIAHAQDQVAQALRRLLDRGHHARTEVRIGHIVIAVDDDALRRDLPGFQLQAVLVDILVAQLHQPHDGRLEEHLAYRPVPRLTGLGRAAFQSHVRRRSRLRDLRPGHRVTANIDDGIALPGGHGVFTLCENPHSRAFDHDAVQSRLKRTPVLAAPTLRRERRRGPSREQLTPATSGMPPGNDGCLHYKTENLFF